MKIYFLTIAFILGLAVTILLFSLLLDLLQYLCEVFVDNKYPEDDYQLWKD